MSTQITCSHLALGLGWRHGLVHLQQWSRYLQGPGFESHLRPVDFFACNKVSPLNSLTHNANICAMCRNHLSWTFIKLKKTSHHSKCTLYNVYITAHSVFFNVIMTPCTCLLFRLLCLLLESSTLYHQYLLQALS